MNTLHHAVKINAPREVVWRALSNIAEMEAWHEGSVEGDIAPGLILTLKPKSEMQFSWRTDKLEPETLLVQTCIEGPGSSPGKVLTFTVSDLQEGVVLVQLSDGEWQINDPHLPFCNAYWGEVLFRLKTHAEKE